MGPEKQKESIDYVELCALFSNAEAKIKKVEHLANGVVIPAVNQLRYAGSHLTRVLRGCEDSATELKRASDHCKRASFDACEAGLIYCLKIIKQFQEDYRKTKLMPVLPDWLQYSECARKAHSLVQISQDEHRIQSYEKAEAALDALIEIIHKFPAAREELNKSVKKDRLVSYTFILAGIAVIVALAAWLWPRSPTTSSAPPDVKPPAQSSSEKPAPQHKEGAETKKNMQK